MAGANYDVRATLLMQARGAYGEVRKVAGEVRALGEGLKTARSGFRDMVGQAVAFGAAYLGFRAVSNAVVSLTKGAVAYTSELEANKIGLQSVLSAVENTDWETAGKRASAAFAQIQMMAIKSPATSAEMFDIFNGIVGPVEAAGFSMQKVLNLTQDTVLAASALNEDFPQASRDINMMARGMAGAHVKLFSMLKATGAIKEDAEAFNQMAPEKRIELIAAGLKKFAKGGEAFGSSWKGVTSTLTDIFDNLKASAFSPILKIMGRNLEKFNGYILDHKASIQAFLTNVGRDLGNRIDTLFQKAVMGFGYIQDHWDTILDRFHQVVNKVKEVAPIIAKAALVWEVSNMGRNIVGGGLSAAGGLMNLVGGAGEGAAGLAGALGLGAGRVAPAAMTMANSPFGMMGAGGMAMVNPFGMMGAGATEGAAAAGAAEGGVGMAALGASLTALAPVLGLVAAALALLLAIGLAFADQWKNMLTIFGSTGSQTMSMLVDAGEAIWSTLSPIFKAIGSVLLIPITALWLVFTTLLRGFLLVLTAVFDVLGALANVVWATVKPAFDFLFGLFKDLAAFINDVFGEATRFLKEIKGGKEATPLNDTESLSTEPKTDYAIWQGGQDAIDLSKATKGGVKITQDFRGSRISVKQEFKGDQDPDRIVMAMMSDLTRQAENRISSGYAGALTR